MDIIIYVKYTLLYGLRNRPMTNCSHIIRLTVIHRRTRVLLNTPNNARNTGMERVSMVALISIVDHTITTEKYYTASSEC